MNSKLGRLFSPIAPTLVLYVTGQEPASPKSVIGSADTKQVAWQHQGLGLGSTGPAQGIYQSIRLNRENPVAAGGNGFGTTTQSINAAPYRGKEIKLVAEVRTKVSGTGNQGQLWLRVDKPDRGRGFFDNMADRPIKNFDWQSYEIVGNVADDATAIVFGGFLKGSGQLWIDDFALQFKNEDGQWTDIELENPGFEQGNGKKPKNWFAASPGYLYQLEDRNAAEGKNVCRSALPMIHFRAPYSINFRKPERSSTRNWAEGCPAGSR